MGVTYLDDGGYISGRVLDIWTMEVTYLDGCYISGRWRLHIWTGVRYLDGNIIAIISLRTLHDEISKKSDTFHGDIENIQNTDLHTTTI